MDFSFIGKSMESMFSICWMWHLIRLRSFQQSQQDRVSRGRILITFSEITQKLTQKKLVENVVTVKIAKRFYVKIVWSVCPFTMMIKQYILILVCDIPLLLIRRNSNRWIEFSSEPISDFFNWPPLKSLSMENLCESVLT